MVIVLAVNSAVNLHLIELIAQVINQNKEYNQGVITTLFRFQETNKHRSLTCLRCPISQSSGDIAAHVGTDKTWQLNVLIYWLICLFSPGCLFHSKLKQTQAFVQWAELLMHSACSQESSWLLGYPSQGGVCQGCLMAIAKLVAGIRVCSHCKVTVCSKIGRVKWKKILQLKICHRRYITRFSHILPLYLILFLRNISKF